MRPLGRLLAAAGTAALLVSGCGAGTAPHAAVPELGAVYSSIEDALSEERYAQAREDLHRLVAATESARAAGELDEAHADRVLAAAARLLATLPAPDARATPEPDEPVPSEPSEGDEMDEDAAGSGSSDGTSTGGTSTRESTGGDGKGEERRNENAPQENEPRGTSADDRGKPAQGGAKSGGRGR